MPPKSGKSDGIPHIDASQSNLGWPSYILFAVTTPRDSLIISRVISCVWGPKNSIDGYLYFLTTPTIKVLVLLFSMTSFQYLTRSKL